MKSEQQLIREGIINESKITSNHTIAQFYLDQLSKFSKIGMGGETENGVIITKSLVNITEERLEQLRPFLRIKKKGETNGTV